MKNHFFSLIQFVIQTTLIELSKSNHLKQFFQLSVFTFTAFFSLPQSIIKGKVADKDGIPLAYATIFIKRTMHGTMSDPAAAYSLATKAPGKQTIIGSYVGC